jgi:selenocysteine-specific elongation factor
MPQTREHVAIAHLLGVERGVIVITKRDLVTNAELALTIEEVRSFTAGTFLENADVVCTSTKENQGIQELKQALDGIPPMDHQASGIVFPFLPVDRAFAMPGFGLVVTGTLRGSDLTARSNVELLPSRQAVTIRGLQVHNQAVERATPGQRVAVNLRHGKRGDVARGDVLVAHGRIEPTERIDVELRLLQGQNQPLKNGTTVEFLAGTTNAMARVRLLDRKQLDPGATGFAQLRFQRSMAAHQMQRFIIRRGALMQTIGGGVILDTHPAAHRRIDASITARLDTIAHGNPIDKAQMFLSEADVAGTTLDALSDLMGMGPDAVDAALASDRPVLTVSGTLISQSVYKRLIEDILAEVTRYHEKYPRHSGISIEKILRALSRQPASDVFQHAIDKLRSTSRIENQEGTLRLAGFDPWAGLTETERRFAAEMEEDFRARQLALTYVHQAEDTDQVRRDVFHLLCHSNRLVRIKKYGAKSDMVVHVENYDAAVAKIVGEFTYPRQFTVSEVRELLGANRQFTVPFLEHLDTAGVTIRMGNMRQLRTQIGQLSEATI